MLGMTPVSCFVLEGYCAETSSATAASVLQNNLIVEMLVGRYFRRSCSPALTHSGKMLTVDLVMSF